MGIEIINNQANLLAIRIINLKEPRDLMCPIKLGPMLLWIYIPPARGSVNKKIEQVPYRTYSSSSLYG